MARVTGYVSSKWLEPKTEKVFRDMKYRASLFIHTETDIHIDTLNDIEITRDIGVDLGL